MKLRDSMAEEEEDTRDESELEEHELELKKELQRYHQIRLDSLPPLEVPAGYKLVAKRKTDQTKTFLTGCALFLSVKAEPFSGTVRVIHGHCRHGTLYVLSDTDGLEYAVEVPLQTVHRMMTLPPGQPYSSPVFRFLVEGLPPGRGLQQAR